MCCSVSNSIRAAIVGLGNMGSAHANCIFGGQVENLTLAAVCDIDPQKREWAGEHLPGVPVYDHIEAMLEVGGFDFLIIAVPHPLHPVFATMAFRMGYNVLTEKPAGIDVKSVRLMNEEAKKSGKLFGIMFNQRTNPLFAKARELVQGGGLGELKRFSWTITNWYRSQSYYDSGSWRATWRGEGGGVMMNQCPHNLDIWQWITGLPTRVRGFCYEAKYHNIEVEDDVTVFAEYANGATATFIATTGEYPGTNRMEIAGDLGKLVIENGELKLWLLPEPERRFCFTVKEGFPNLPLTTETILPDREETAHRGILQNYTNTLLGKESLLAPGEEGIKGLSITNAAYLSSWEDRWVELPVEEEAYAAALARKQEGSAIRTDATEEKGMKGSYSNRWSVNW